MAASNPDVSTSVTHAATSMSASTPSHKSCRTKKTEGASFIQDIRDHFDEFVHASMDEHKACFKNTLNKLFKTTKDTPNIVAVSPPVESVLSLNTITSSSSSS